jgi:hypothetical protein
VVGLCQHVWREKEWVEKEKEREEERVGEDKNRKAK